MDGKFEARTISTRRYFGGDDDGSEAREKCFSRLKNESKLLERTREKLMRRYGELKTVVGRGVRKLLKSIATRFAAMETYIGKTILK